MWSCLLNGCRVLVLQDKKLLDTGCTTMWIHLTRLSCTLRGGKDDKFMLCIFYQNLNIFKGHFVLFNKGFKFYMLCMKFLGQSFSLNTV